MTLGGTIHPDQTWADALDWDPRWCKDPEVLASPCPKGHVARNVDQQGRLKCYICQPKYTPGGGVSGKRRRSAKVGRR